MSAVTKPEGTAVQMTERAAIGVLPPAVQQQLELRKLTNQVAGKLAELNWGKQLDDATRRAVADWGQRFRVDTTIEINVLGGNVYLNAHFYLRKLSEMIEAGLVEYAYADHVEEDPRLEKLGPEGEGETSRRLRERIMHRIPDAAASAVVFRVKLRNMDKEIVGVKWCGNGTRKSDPVGDSFPVESSESRAARRAMRLITTHLPKRLEDEILEIEHGAEVLTERVEHARKEVAAAIARETRPRLMASSDQPYGEVTTPATQPREAPTVVVDTSKRPDPAVLQQHLDTPDPYADDAPPAPAKPEPKRSKAYQTPFPFGNETRGKPIGEFPNAMLLEAREVAIRRKMDSFVEAVDELLEERRLAALDAEGSAS